MPTPLHSDPWFIGLQVLSGLFIFVLGTVALAMLVLLVLDRAQRRDAIRHNYPVIGRFRELFEYLGVFFRRYFLAMDREELPFNRAQRDWVQRAATRHSTNAAFGSTRDLRPAGTVLSANCPFPTLEEDSVAPGPLTIGSYCAQPYTTASLLNISAMSYSVVSAGIHPDSARRVCQNERRSDINKSHGNMAGTPGRRYGRAGPNNR